MSDIRGIDPKTDEIGAFCQHMPPVFIEGADTGHLYGLKFAAKDLYAIAEHRNAAGNPDWLESHAPAPSTCPVVQSLLDAGANLVGKTHTDELAFSLNGENHWYGTPKNVAAPGRIPGGSSNGSAAAVAAGLCDFALGTDTGGSVRAPASFCKLFGMRTTTDLISVDGVVPLAPAFDTVGWFTRDLDTFRRVGDVLLPPSPRKQLNVKRLRLLMPAFEQAKPEFLAQARNLAAATGLPVDELALPNVDLQAWAADFRVLQLLSIRETHLDWLETVNPTFGPGIADRFQWVRDLDPDSEQVAAAKRTRTEATAEIDSWFDDGESLVLLPSVADAAPLPSSQLTAMDDFRVKTMRLTSIAGLAATPQFGLPLLRTDDGLPAGLSVMGPRHSDAALMAIATRFSAG